jgi:hypothetical protein
MMGAPGAVCRAIRAVEVDWSDFHFNGFILRDASLRDAPLDEGVGGLALAQSAVTMPIWWITPEPAIGPRFARTHWATLQTQTLMVRSASSRDHEATAEAPTIRPNRKLL